MAIDRAREVGMAGHVAVMNEADPAIYRVKGPERVGEERLAGRSEDQCIDATIEAVEFGQCQRVVFLFQHALDAERLIAVREARALGRELDDEAVDSAPQ